MFIAIVFPKVEEFELCGGEKTIDDGLHLVDGGIEKRTWAEGRGINYRRERGGGGADGMEVSHYFATTRSS